MRCTTLNRKGAYFSCLAEGEGADTGFARSGDVTTTAGAFGKGELCSRFGIQPRDLRKLDSGVPTVVPTILVRRAAILVR